MATESPCLTQIEKIEFSHLVLKDGSVASFVNLVGRGKCYGFLMCSQEKYRHLQGKFQEKSGKTIKVGCV